VAWWGLLAPAKTPPEIVARMNAAMAEALNDPAVKQGLSEQGVDYRLSRAGRIGRFVEHEVTRWAKVVKDKQHRGERLTGAGGPGPPRRAIEP
jgi:tripartite-type tricarboxylate transporter receptor subunit TctC